MCGQSWFDDFMDSLPRSETLRVSSKTETCRFRFGDGEVFTSHKAFNIPIQIGSVQAMLETHVVGADIPLLLSRESLKRAEAEIDFQHDTIRILGEKVGLRISTTGHLLLP